MKSARDGWVAVAVSTYVLSIALLVGVCVGFRAQQSPQSRFTPALSTDAVPQDH